MSLTTEPIKILMKNLPPKINNLDHIAEWYAMLTGQLQNHNAWCLKRFAKFKDYVDHDWNSSEYRYGKCIR